MATSKINNNLNITISGFLNVILCSLTDNTVICICSICFDFRIDIGVFIFYISRFFYTYIKREGAMYFNVCLVNFDVNRCYKTKKKNNRGTIIINSKRNTH